MDSGAGARTAGTDETARTDETDETAALASLRFLLTAFAAVGVSVIVLGALLWALLSWNGPDPTDTDGFGRYLQVAAVWAAGAGIVGLCGAQVRRDVGERSGTAWLAWCDLGMVLALLWPLQVVAVAVLFVVRTAGRARWLRGCAASAGVCLAAVGSAWGVTGYAAEQPWTSDGPADRAVVGTWNGPAGETLVLRADGGFRSTAGAGAGYDWSTGEGRWRLTDMLDPGATLTLDFAAGGSDELVVYGALSPSTLCQPLAEEWCRTSLHR
ncbi:hypothetical protein ACFV0O_01020 [Kitasatospora sp. NPDC059577]|uniref:hypothetical protein n=1 Tax=Kitasatospora sp. NPDC059577 TaxID=3346873 RepID=UPI0036BFDA05